MNSKRARKYNSSKNNKRDNEDLAIRNKSNQDENYKINNQKTKFLKNYNTRSLKFLLQQLIKKILMRLKQA